MRSPFGRRPVQAAPSTPPASARPSSLLPPELAVLGGGSLAVGATLSLDRGEWSGRGNDYALNILSGSGQVLLPAADTFVTVTALVWAVLSGSDVLVLEVEASNPFGSASAYSPPLPVPSALPGPDWVFDGRLLRKAPLPPPPLTTRIIGA